MTRNMNVYSKFTDMFKYLIKGTYVHRLMNICSPTHEASFVGSRTYVLRNICLLLTLMTLGITSALKKEATSSILELVRQEGKLPLD